MKLEFPDITLLAIESSCDETSAAIIRGNKILANFIANQKIHSQYGGVVPELASREHQKNIVPVVHEAVKEAGIDLKDIDGIAFTQGPGLLGSLMVGTSFAKSLSLGLNVPLVGVHHMHAHILAHFIEDAGEHMPTLPMLCLTVSGGHTQLVVVKGPGDLEVIGGTLDDAAGEAFDKSAKIMGLPYPGGPLIDKLAEEGNPHAFEFSGSKLPNYEFSFSGFKTSVLRLLQKEMRKDDQFIENNKADLCASVRWTIVDSLMHQVKKAAKDLGIKDVAIAGGVSANQLLRRTLVETGKQEGWNTYIPKFAYCTDNAAMIAMGGMFKWMSGERTEISEEAQARLPF
ncbi:MAG: tRNA (adenosine(37)-N6)-threonylcarbamoyltransferase complex transferase subunit TsaD [Flavobacteriales bacterium]|nr:tRNA (adenosine(37)-N6)-threonylcarbamoyltransferase complex transferase subunit TsaD [Flavobacteriales bacterium]